MVLPGYSDSSMHPSQQIGNTNTVSLKKEMKSFHSPPKKKKLCRKLKFTTTENAQDALTKKKAEFYEKAMEIEAKVLQERLTEAQVKRKAAEYEVQIKMQAADYELEILKIRKEKELFELKKAKSAFVELESTPGGYCNK